MAPVEVEGFWGKQTATIDWCEENYVVSYYIAEFWNTVSNAILIFGPLIMLFRGWKENHEKRFIYSCVAVAVVGIGSWLFHMTLQYTMQLMDELPMIWGSSFLIYSLYMVKSKPDEENVALQVLLISYCLVVTLVYILINAPIFHEVSYGIMVFGMVAMALKIILTMDCNKILFATALGTYSLGFLLWNIDNIYCHHLKSMRNHPIGRLTGMLFQFHAWWHVFAGTGTYLALLFTLHSRSLYLQQKPKVEFFLCVWPYVAVGKEARKLK